MIDRECKRLYTERFVAIGQLESLKQRYESMQRDWLRARGVAVGVNNQIAVQQMFIVKAQREIAAISQQAQDAEPSIQAVAMAAVQQIWSRIGVANQNIAMSGGELQGAVSAADAIQSQAYIDSRLSTCNSR